MLALLVLGSIGCARKELEPTRDRIVAAAPAPGAPTAPAAAAPVAPACEARIRKLLKLPPLPGAPALDAARTELLANVKAEPVVFVRRPEVDSQARSTARAYAAQLGKTRYPSEVLAGLLPAFEAKPEIGRQSVLREGYLYAETPKLGVALVARIGPQHLFEEPRIWIQRGERTSWAIRRPDGHYVWQDGPERGRAVRLLLFDRIGVGAPQSALHRDFRALRYRLHFDRAKIRHMTADQVLADLRYGGRYWVPTLLRAEGARLELECEAPAADESSSVSDARMQSGRRERALRALRRAMLAQIDERLPFDEQRSTLGRGRLRSAWRSAYLDGKQSYRVDVSYPIFDGHGRPMTPQVCVDFLMDTLERASGTWWQPRGETPGKLRGAIDFDELGRDELRSVPGFVELALSKPEWFEVTVPHAEHVSIGKLEHLALELTRHADDYDNGDILVIDDRPAWDERDPHYHSFFVYETDPLTGFAIALVGNAGQPSIKVWRLEAARTPKGALVRRIRPKLEWLESIVPALEDPALVPPPLGAGARPN